MGGSSSTQTTKIPDYMSDAGRTAAQRANMIYEAGRMPFTGIDVVAINPAEQAAIDQAAMAASAFGMPSAAANPFEGMEVLESGGLRGYSSYPIYISDMQRLKDQRPEQYAALARQSGFDPITGQSLSAAAPTVAQSSYVGGGGSDGPTRMERIMAEHDAMRAAAKLANRDVSVGLDDGTRRTASTPIRPVLRPKSQSGLAELDNTIRRVSGGIFGRLTGRG